MHRQTISACVVLWSCVCALHPTVMFPKMHV